ncbi:MAG: hypothetical protein HQ512_07740 [Rhodospirillales bacterium]|nr:hypothetical protein [Rhodospirillales bacterium]
MAGVDPVTMLVLQAGAGLVASKQQAKAQSAAANAARQSQIQAINQVQEIRERQRRERLRRGLATQRARFASQGLGRGGSADAVLKGLALESDRATEDERSLNALRIGDINNAFDQRRRKNLLEASNAKRRTAFDLLSKGLNSFSLLEG